MIGYVMIGTNDLDRGARFYDALLAPLGLVQVERVETYAAYAPKAAKDAIEFYVTRPFDQAPATPGNGTMIALSAPLSAQLTRTGLRNKVGIAESWTPRLSLRE